MANSPDDSAEGADEMRSEYEFGKLRGVTRGKYADLYQQQLRIVRLADDVASAFPDEASVNNALRVYLRDHSPLDDCGIGASQAADLRQRLAAFAEDWDRPEMNSYDAI